MIPSGSNGYSIVFIPRSWAFGRWELPPKKIIYAFGPFRFARHFNLGPWKPELVVTRP